MKIGLSCAVFALIAFLSVPVQAAFFVMPMDGVLYARPVGGSAGGVTAFGTGTSEANFNPLFTGLPFSSEPAGEVAVGTFLAGTSVDFGMRTEFGSVYFAFSNDETSNSARTTYMDLNNSLGMGGSVVEPLGGNQYLLHLDDAASFFVDDDDDDVIIGLRVAPLPEPAGLCLLASSGLLLMRRRRW